MLAAMGLLPPVIGFFIASAFCLLIVVWQMFKHQDALKALLGLVTGVYAFLWGWQNVRRIRNLGGVMTFWSWCLGAGLVLWAIMGDKV